MNNFTATGCSISPQTECKDVSRETSSLSIRGEIRQIRYDYARNAASFNLRLTCQRRESARPPFAQCVACNSTSRVKSCLLCSPCTIPIRKKFTNAQDDDMGSRRSYTKLSGTRRVAKEDRAQSPPSALMRVWGRKSTPPSSCSSAVRWAVARRRRRDPDARRIQCTRPRCAP